MALFRAAPSQASSGNSPASGQRLGFCFLRPLWSTPLRLLQEGSGFQGRRGVGGLETHILSPLAPPASLHRVRLRSQGAKRNLPAQTSSCCDVLSFSFSTYSFFSVNCVVDFLPSSFQGRMSLSFQTFHFRVSGARESWNCQPGSSSNQRVCVLPKDDIILYTTPEGKASGKRMQPSSLKQNVAPLQSHTCSHQSIIHKEVTALVEI